MMGTSPSGLNQTEENIAAEHESGVDSNYTSNSSVELALVFPVVVPVVVVRLCVRNASIYPISG
jgi:hypothetical protein